VKLNGYEFIFRPEAPDCMGKVKEPGDVNDPNICVPELDS
jgi:hypothetical protein